MFRMVALLYFTTFIVANIAYATNLAIDLNVTGTIIASPYFTDSSNTVISSISFNFGSIQAREAATNIDSDQESFIFHDPANSGGVSVLILQNPVGCSIGSDNVSDNDILLVAGGVAASSGTVGIQEGQVMYVNLRFDSAGSYGDSSGSVSCTTAGTLTFSY